MAQSQQKIPDTQKPKKKWTKKQQFYDPNNKGYLVLSQEGRLKYNQISINAYKLLFFWLTLGTATGYTVYKFFPLMKLTNSSSNLPRNLGIIIGLIFTYNGTKLMERQKRRGIRQISKNPKYYISEEDHNSKLLTKKEEIAEKI